LYKKGDAANIRNDFERKLTFINAKLEVQPINSTTERLMKPNALKGLLAQLSSQRYHHRHASLSSFFGYSAQPLNCRPTHLAFSLVPKWRPS